MKFRVFSLIVTIIQSIISEKQRKKMKKDEKNIDFV